MLFFLKFHSPVEGPMGWEVFMLFWDGEMKPSGTWTFAGLKGKHEEKNKESEENSGTENISTTKHILLV